MRKPIQISGNMVLCDDGAIFELWKERKIGPPILGDAVSYYIGEMKDSWRRLPDIPQDDEVKNEKETSKEEES